MYTDDKPQVKAAKASAEARSKRAADRRHLQARLEDFRKHPGMKGHPLTCVCDQCELWRAIGRAFGYTDA